MKRIDDQERARIDDRSRDAFHAHEPNLAEIIVKIGEDSALTHTQRRDMLSACSRFSGMIGIPATEIRARPLVLRKRLETLSFAAQDIQKKTLENMRSNLHRALRRYCGPEKQLMRRIPPTPEWAVLLENIKVDFQRQALYRLVAYTTRMRIHPNDVSNATLLDLYTALEAEEFIKQPRSILKNTISNWNRCARTIPGWPQTRLASPFAKTPETFPLSSFPVSFQKEISGWANKMRDPDILDPDALGKALREETIQHRIRLLRQFASALAHQENIEIDKILSLSILLEPKHFTSALRYFLNKGQNKKTSSLYNLANFMRLLGKHHCRLDEDTLKQLGDICRRLNPGKRAHMSERNRERLRQFDDERNVRNYLFLPDTLAKAAEKQKNAQRKAKFFERAAMTSLFINLGPRSLSLRKIELGNLTPVRNGKDETFLLTLSEDKMKTDHVLELELPVETAKLVREYIEKYRRLLPGAKGSFLFPGAKGLMRSKSAVYEITKTIKKYTGLHVNPHLTRHSLAKITAERDPTAYLSASRVLGHRSLNTTMSYYLGTEAKAAGRHIDRILEGAKGPAKKKKV